MNLKQMNHFKRMNFNFWLDFCDIEKKYNTIPCDFESYLFYKFFSKQGENKI